MFRHWLVHCLVPVYIDQLASTWIEIPLWGQKPLTTGMTGYRENRSKTAQNSKFEFEKSRIGKPVGMTSLPIGMTGNETGKLVGQQ
jgi:hypothetical protein